MPLTPFSNTTISPYIAWSRPWIVAIPSPTRITVPISSLLVLSSKSLISFFKTARTFSLVTAPFLAESITFCLIPSSFFLIEKSNCLSPSVTIKPPISESSLTTLITASFAFSCLQTNSLMPFNCSSSGSVTQVIVASATLFCLLSCEI